MFTQKDKDDFFKTVDSLKKYRRANLVDEEGNDLLKYLYTDLLPNEQILKTCLKNNTTFIIGRKGTGKSTIFLKLQQELRKKNEYLACYIDTKTVFESSKTEYVDAFYLKDVIPEDILKMYLVERTFIQNILKEIKKEIYEKTENIMDRVGRAFGVDKREKVRKKLEELEFRINDNENLEKIEIPLIKKIFTNEIYEINSEQQKSLDKQGYSEVSAISSPMGVEVAKSCKYMQSNGVEVENKFSDLFMQVFQIKNIIEEIKEILNLLNIKNLIVLLDDFSEIDDASMRTFVDVILAPLNNWSDDFIKFKVAAYPNRIYYGKIDKGKIDIIDLDFYNLYSDFDRTTMEEKAINFTERLLKNRFDYFCEKDIKQFFDTRKMSMTDYYEYIFNISMNVPRIIGYILFYCYESRILFDKLINKSALDSASEKYYEKIIQPFFDNTTYSMMSYDEKISVFQLKELLKTITSNLKDIRKKIVAGQLVGYAYDKDRKNPYTSHFYFDPSYEEFIRTLELNFFISKYGEMSSRDGRKVLIYALNYGLCVHNNIRWGKPEGSEYRKYFIERPFDFNDVIYNFLKKSKKIVCINQKCTSNYSIEDLEHLKFNKMRCPECGSEVRIVPIADSIIDEINKIDEAKLLPSIEYSILYELNKKDVPLRAKEIGEELDCSYQLIGKKAAILSQQKGLIEKETNGGKVFYKLTEKAKKTYFVG